MTMGSVMTRFKGEYDAVDVHQLAGALVTTTAAGSPVSSVFATSVLGCMLSRMLARAIECLISQFRSLKKS
jgi:hypothetical protein